MSAMDVESRSVMSCQASASSEMLAMRRAARNFRKARATLRTIEAKRG